MSAKIKFILPLLVILSITAVVYWQTTTHDFIYSDDNEQIINNTDITAVKPLGYFSHFSVGMYQPLTTASYGLDFLLFKLNPTGYHLTSLAYHLINIVLVFWLACLITGNKRIGSLAALIFAIHPLNVEAVAWLSARSALLFTMFLLAGLIGYLYYLKSAKKILYLWCFLSFCLACLAKSQAVILPLLLLTADYYYDKLTWRKVLAKIPFFIVSALITIIAVIGRLQAGHFKVSFVTYHFYERLLFIGYGPIFYLVKTIAPINLAFNYPLPEKINGFLPPSFYLAPLLLILLILFLTNIKTNRRAVIALSAGFIISLLPVLKFSNLLQIVTDRYYYQAGIVIAIALALSINYLFDKFKNLTLFIISCLSASFVFLIIISLDRLAVWQNDLTLLTDTINQYPHNHDSSILYDNRGLAKMKRQDYAGALEDFNQAVALDARAISSFDNRATIKGRIYHDYRGGWLDYQTAIVAEPHNPVHYYNLAGMLLANKQLQPAADYYRQALKINEQPLPPNAKIEPALIYFNLGVTDYELKNNEEAAYYLTQALTLKPDLIMTRHYLDLLAPLPLSGQKVKLKP